MVLTVSWREELVALGAMLSWPSTRVAVVTKSTRVLITAKLGGVGSLLNHIVQHVLVQHVSVHHILVQHLVVQHILVQLLLVHHFLVQLVLVHQGRSEYADELVEGLQGKHDGAKRAQV